jgi:hypothetical protein
MTSEERAPRSYSERRALVARSLEPIIAVSSLVPTNSEPAFEPDLLANSLMCSWGDPQTGQNRVSVYIHQVRDGSRKADRLREMMAEEASPDDAREISGQAAGEFVFVLDYVGTVTAVVADCVIEIIPNGIDVALADFADVALGIGRTVGCSAYTDDFTPPTAGGGAPSTWTTADGLIYDPRTPPKP